MKLNNKLQLIAVFMGMLMLTACGGSSTAPTPAAPNPVAPNPAAPNPAAPNPAAPNPVAPSPLDGSWRTRCQASTELTDYDEQQIFNFKGNTLTTTKFFYERYTNASQTCEYVDEALRVQETANIEFGATVNPAMEAEHSKIKITPTKVILVPMDGTSEALFNSASHTSKQSIYNGYGKKWWVYYRKDISSIPDARTNFKIDQSEPDILQISKKMVDGTTHKVLKFGIKGGNVDSDGRPLALDNSIIAIKQQKTTTAQTAQAAGLTGQWKYNCRLSKGDNLVQSSTLDFMGNKLTTLISFYYSRDTNTGCNETETPLYQVKIEADIVVGKVINKGEANEHTQIGIKATKVEIKPSNTKVTSANGEIEYSAKINTKNSADDNIKNLYHGYGQTGWKSNAWKNISLVPNAITALNIGTQAPDIFNISTVTTDNGSHKVLKMGYYKGSFDINGRAMSLEAKGAVFQPK